MFTYRESFSLERKKTNKKIRNNSKATSSSSSKKNGGGEDTKIVVGDDNSVFRVLIVARYKITDNTVQFKFSLITRS